MTRHASVLLASLAVVGLFSRGSQAASQASDNASDPTYANIGPHNAPNGFNGLNGGTGFGPWSVTPNPQIVDTQGDFINQTNGVNYFDIYANSGTTAAARAFTGTLSPGQSFSTDDYLNSGATGALLGMQLTDSSGNVLFDFHAVGGTNNYVLTDANQSNTPETGVAYNYHVLDNFKFTLLDPQGDYQFTVTGPALSGNPNGVTGGSQTFTGMINNTSGIANVVYYDTNGGNGSDVEFNNLAVTGTAVPEPASLALIALFGVMPLFARRRA